MIPDREVRARPPLTLELAVVLAILAPFCHFFAAILLFVIGFRGDVALSGMAAVLTYGSLFALCAVRFGRPPAQELALGAPPALSWLAALLLLPSLLLSSEIDNWVKVFYPIPADLLATATAAEPPPFFGTTLAIVMIGVRPLAYEFFFRGVLQPLAVSRIGVFLGVLLTATLSAFALGLAMGGFWGVLPAFANSLVLCVLRQTSGSLWPPLLLHIAIGGVYVASNYTLFGVPGFDDVTAAHTPWSFLAFGAVSTALGLVLCALASRRSA